MGLFAFNVQVSRERQETGGREEGMTRRKGPFDAEYEPGSPAARTVASTHGVGALPSELCSTPLEVFLLISIIYVLILSHRLSDCIYLHFVLIFFTKNN